MSLRFSYQLGYMDDAVAGVLVEQLTALLGRLGGVGGVPLGGINTIIPEQEAAALLHAAGPVVEHDTTLLTLPSLCLKEPVMRPLSFGYHLTRSVMTERMLKHTSIALKAYWSN